MTWLTTTSERFSIKKSTFKKTTSSYDTESLIFVMFDLE